MLDTPPPVAPTRSTSAASERQRPRFRIPDAPTTDGSAGGPTGPVEGGPASLPPPLPGKGGTVPDDGASAGAAGGDARSPAAVSRSRSRRSARSGARGQLLQLRCTPAERERWRAKATEAGVSVSALLRDALDGAKARRRRRSLADPALVRELARVGNNLNQLARWANRDKGGVEAVAVLARLVEIERELVALRGAAERAGNADAQGAEDAMPEADAVPVAPPGAEPVVAAPTAPC